MESRIDTHETGYLRQMLDFKIQALKTFGKDPRHAAVESFIIEHAVLKRGKPKPKRIKFGKQGECFKNAAELALNNRDLIYVEGYAGRPNLPLEFRHAWLEDPFGDVIDVTWRDVSEKEEYMGVQIPADFLLKNVIKTKYYSVLWTGPLDIPNFDTIHRLGEMLKTAPIMRSA